MHSIFIFGLVVRVSRRFASPLLTSFFFANYPYLHQATSCTAALLQRRQVRRSPRQENDEHYEMVVEEVSEAIMVAVVDCCLIIYPQPEGKNEEREVRM
jgi:hypothetical protein